MAVYYALSKTQLKTFFFGYPFFIYKRCQLKNVKIWHHPIIHAIKKRESNGMRGKTYESCGRNICIKKCFKKVI